MSPVSLPSVLLLIGQAWALPIGGSVDSSYDTWATALSDVGPLVLLVGERSTKQLLRDVRGIGGAFSLAAAPLGLVSIVTSLLRMSGSHRMRSFLGYEQESRSVAALEMSRVNCNGVHAELIDGHLVRTTAAMSALHAGAVGVSALQSTITPTADRDIVTQLQSCHAYEATKQRLRVPSTDAGLRWCAQILIDGFDEEALEAQLCELLANALQANLLGEKSEILRRQLKTALHLPDASPGQGANKKEDHVKVLNLGANPISFVLTFDAVSEYCSAQDTSQRVSFLIGFVSLLTILSLYLVELRYSLLWKMSTGWLLTILGYFGIVTFVTLAARHILRASHSIPLGPKSAHLSQAWKSGLVVATQSDSKTGADLLTVASGGHQVFEAMWLKPLTSLACVKADVIGLCLTLSFLCHYLGLRSSSWWLGVCELIVCISAAFARSLTKRKPLQFRLRESQKSPVRVDWRCCGTGLITVQSSIEVDGVVQPKASRLDLRVYSSDSNIPPPAFAESLAFQTAVLCLGNRDMMSWIIEKCGMRFWLTKTGPGDATHAVVVSFDGGIIAQEGLVTSDVTMCVAFACTTGGLAAPTAWLVRAIMRQPRWRVNRKAFCSINDTIGKVHIPSLSSIMAWWTMSELRNGHRDNQENLQWAFLLINTAFFLLLHSMAESSDLAVDASLVKSLSDLHRVVSPSHKVVQDFFERLKTESTVSTSGNTNSKISVSPTGGLWSPPGLRGGS